MRPGTTGDSEAARRGNPGEKWLLDLTPDNATAPAPDPASLPAVPALWDLRHLAELAIPLSVCPSPVHADQDLGPEPGRVLADGLDVGYFDRRWTPNEKPAI